MFGQISTHMYVLFAKLTNTVGICCCNFFLLPSCGNIKLYLIHTICHFVGSVLCFPFNMKLKRKKIEIWF